MYSNKTVNTANEMKRDISVNPPTTNFYVNIDVYKEKAKH